LKISVRSVNEIVQELSRSYRRTAQISSPKPVVGGIGSRGALLNHLGSKNPSVKGFPSMSGRTLSFDCSQEKSGTLKAKLQAEEQAPNYQLSIVLSHISQKNERDARNFLCAALDMAACAPFFEDGA
jgi:hypothetical protein